MLNQKTLLKINVKYWFKISKANLVMDTKLTKMRKGLLSSSGRIKKFNQKLRLP